MVGTVSEFLLHTILSETGPRLLVSIVSFPKSFRKISRYNTKVTKCKAEIANRKLQVTYCKVKMALCKQKMARGKVKVTKYEL